MAVVTWCEKHHLVFCVLCSGENRPPALTEIAEEGKTFAAHYSSGCRACDRPIVKGQRITRWAIADDVFFLHAGCR